jgi:translation initiation factor 2B subunit (eIF-2B alpha/beta/delta family)
VGADNFLCDGSLINGAPTYKLAEKAKECGIPFYSVCETTKANTMSYLGEKTHLKEGFELIPSNLITGIITEKGILHPHEIVEIMKKKSKFLEPLSDDL